jgi:hypothetical protein
MTNSFFFSPFYWRSIRKILWNLFLWGFFDYLNIDEISPLMKNLSFVELIFKLNRNRNCWDLYDANKIHEFYSKYETLLTSQLKKKKKSPL